MSACDVAWLQTCRRDVPKLAINAMAALVSSTALHTLGTQNGCSFDHMAMLGSET
jgi:hypothetical protein